MSKADVKDTIAAMDVGGDGRVDLEEFKTWWLGNSDRGASVGGMHLRVLQTKLLAGSLGKHVKKMGLSVARRRASKQTPTSASPREQASAKHNTSSSSHSAHSSTMDLRMHVEGGVDDGAEVRVEVQQAALTENAYIMVELYPTTALPKSEYPQMVKAMEGLVTAVVESGVVPPQLLADVPTAVLGEEGDSCILTIPLAKAAPLAPNEEGGEEGGAGEPQDAAPWNVLEMMLLKIGLQMRDIVPMAILDLRLGISMKRLLDHRTTPIISLVGGMELLCNTAVTNSLITLVVEKYGGTKQMIELIQQDLALNGLMKLFSKLSGTFRFRSFRGLTELAQEMGLGEVVGALTMQQLVEMFQSGFRELAEMCDVPPELRAAYGDFRRTFLGASSVEVGLGEKCGAIRLSTRNLDPFALLPDLDDEDEDEDQEEDED